jgi:hypothetical protein
MKRRVRIAVAAVVVLVLAFGGLRLYGAYATEHKIAKDTVAELEESAATAEHAAADAKVASDQASAAWDCDLQWMLYAGNALGLPKHPLPNCAGSMGAESSDAAENKRDAAEAVYHTDMARIDKEAAAQWRRYDRNYVLQTKVIACRIWAALIGTICDANRVQTEDDWEKNHPSKR